VGRIPPQRAVTFVWFAMQMQRGTPKDIVARINHEMAKSLGTSASSSRARSPGVIRFERREVHFRRDRQVALYHREGRHLEDIMSSARPRLDRGRTMIAIRNLLREVDAWERMRRT
jgi:hypothetical protein